MKHPTARAPTKKQTAQPIKVKYTFAAYSEFSKNFFQLIINEEIISDSFVHFTTKMGLFYG